MDLGLEGKNVLITGGSRGIGKATAKEFQKEGANVSIVGRTLSTLQATQQEIEGISIYQADIMNRDQRENLFNQYIADHQTIDVLVNNVGGSNGSTVVDTDLEKFYEALEYNFFSAVHLSKLAVKNMIKRESGSIINITSIFGRESGGLVTYNNAKAALISFTKSLATEVVKKGIRVNSIAPGSIMHDDGVWQKRMNEDPKGTTEFLEREIPAGRFGTPAEIAQAVVYVASNKASWLVGSSINVDGGQSKMNM